MKGSKSTLFMLAACLSLTLAPLAGCTEKPEDPDLEKPNPEKPDPDDDDPAYTIKGYKTLKEAFAGKFTMGASLQPEQYGGKGPIDPISTALCKKHFNSVVAGNCMKMISVQRTEGNWTFSEADRFVQFGEANKMEIIGHCLVWHNQVGDWMFKNADGSRVSREKLIERLETHITTVVKRYKGKVKGWDVVNEAFDEGGGYRQSPFFQIIGKEYLEIAFKAAHKADPDVELYYNDYNMWYEGKRKAVVNLVNEFKAKGIRIDAIGMQSHVKFNKHDPSIKGFEESIKAFAATGLNVMITELDMTMFSYGDNSNPYVSGLPADKAKEWSDRMLEFFGLFVKYEKNITRVTTWGIYDAISWMNNQPVKGRTDYPLLFDRQGKPKTVVSNILGGILDDK